MIRFCAASRRHEPARPVFRRARIRCGRLQAELSEADVERPSHLALLRPLRPAGLRTPLGPGRVARRAIRLRRTRLVPVLAFERVPQTLQFQDQGGALRPQFVMRPESPIVPRSSLSRWSASDSRLMATPSRQPRRDEPSSRLALRQVAWPEQAGLTPCERAQISPRLDRTRSPCPHRAPSPCPARRARSDDAI